MPAAINITGERFGRLVAVRDEGSEPGKGRVWLFRCDCGAEVLRRLGSVSSARNRSTSSCGCFRRELSGAQVRDLTGRRFGRLVVLSYAGTPGDAQGVRWLTRCDCGRRHVARSKDLSLGTTTSCGCRRGESGGRVGRAGVSPVAVGARFGRLVVAAAAPAIPRQGRCWRCDCDCGGSTVVRTNLLTTGQTRSCGCLRLTGYLRRNERRLQGQAA